MSIQQIEDIILVIDDDAAVNDVLTLLIERSGYNVLGASNLKDALDKYEDKFNKGIKIIFLDYNIPGEDFFENAKIITTTYKQIKLCAITGEIDSELKQKIKDTTMICKFITKPIKIDPLKDIIKSILISDKE